MLEPWFGFDQLATNMPDKGGCMYPCGSSNLVSCPRFTIFTPPVVQNKTKQVVFHGIKMVFSGSNPSKKNISYFNYNRTNLDVVVQATQLHGF